MSGRVAKYLRKIAKDNRAKYLALKRAYNITKRGQL